MRQSLFAIIAIITLAAGCSRRDALSDRIGGADAIHHADVVANGTTQRNALIYTIDPPRTPFELRKTVTIARDSDKPLGVYVSLLAPFELFWDGERLGSGGNIDNFFVLGGTRQRAGAHALVVRARPSEAMRKVGTFVYGIAVGDYAAMVRARVVSQLLPLSALGVFAVIGAYYAALWFAAGRRASLLVFALLSFAASLLVVAECWRWIVGYPFAWHIVRLHVVDALTFVVALLLPLFFFLDGHVPRARRWTIVTALALAVAFASADSSDQRCLMMFGIGLAAATSAVAYSFVRGRRDYPSAAGVSILATTFLAGGYGFGDRSFFLGFVALIACLLFSLTLQLRRQRREHDEALLRAARLEIELLKRSIAPHFLMNTLTAAMEWLEEEPAEGARFLEALAGELRILGEISGASLIPITRELELCRSHLTIMSYRKAMQFELVTSDVDARDEVPPAIFHTLLENAITHNRYRGERIVFHLRGENRGGARTYTLDTPRSSGRAGDSRDGLGLRYVKTRLEESFPGRWRVDSEGTDERWRTTIMLTA